MKIPSLRRVGQTLKGLVRKQEEGINPKSYRDKEPGAKLLENGDRALLVAEKTRKGYRRATWTLAIVAAAFAANSIHEWGEDNVEGSGERGIGVIVPEEVGPVTIISRGARIFPPYIYRGPEGEEPLFITTDIENAGQSIYFSGNYPVIPHAGGGQETGFHASFVEPAELPILGPGQRHVFRARLTATHPDGVSNNPFWGRAISVQIKFEDGSRAITNLSVESSDGAGRFDSERFCDQNQTVTLNELRGEVNRGSIHRRPVVEVCVDLGTGGKNPGALEVVFLEELNGFTITDFRFDVVDDVGE